MMSDTPITERQQFWLDHIQAADAFDGSIADYARSEGLKPKCRNTIPVETLHNLSPLTARGATMNKEARAYCLVQRKIAAIEYAEKWGNVSKACRTFRVSRAGFY
jgi:hypothetical protein